ncbi:MULTISPECIES: hypothetical protein [unclassified Egicoccus]|uniref:hypothetical protein n=1 Tax=unclassified Egicoccus TaxID=2635606 RepID=UPI00359D0F07
MSPLASWAVMAAIGAGAWLLWLLLRRLEARHVPFCVCSACMAGSVTWNPTNANDRAQVGARPVVASRPDERFRL